MTNALVTSAVAPGVAEAIEVLNRMQTVRNVLAPDLNDQELQLFALVAQRSGLDPFAKQIHAIKRKGRVTFQTGIDGYRSIAERTRQYDGSDLPVFSGACPCGKAPKDHPEKATITVYRWKDSRRVGQPAEAYWHEFHPGDQGDFMWSKMPRNQLAKCAEALALRKLFPYLYADLYTDEEMAQAGPGDSAPLVSAAAQPTAAERVAARRAAIEQPAETPTNATRPGEEAAREEVEEAVVREEDIAPAAPSSNGFCGAESPLDGAKCGIAADVNHSIHREIRDGRAVQTWPAGN
jgi:phage recombination protein Bet